MGRHEEAKSVFSLQGDASPAAAAAVCVFPCYLCDVPAPDQHSGRTQIDLPCYLVTTLHYVLPISQSMQKVEWADRAFHPVIALVWHELLNNMMN